MPGRNETDPLVVHISRTFAAPVALVFSAWTVAEHVRHWFSPHGWSVPEARVEAWVGGAYEWCMRCDADGTEHWTRGVIRQLEPGRLLDIEMRVGADPQHPLFVARTLVTFSAEAGGTRVDVEQSYQVHDPAAHAMIGGAPAGWQQSLQRLDGLLGRLSATAG